MCFFFSGAGEQEASGQGLQACRGRQACQGNQVKLHFLGQCSRSATLWLAVDDTWYLVLELLFPFPHVNKISTHCGWDFVVQICMHGAGDSVLQASSNGDHNRANNVVPVYLSVCDNGYLKYGEGDTGLRRCIRHVSRVSHGTDSGSAESPSGLAKRVR